MCDLNPYFTSRSPGVLHVVKRARMFRRFLFTVVISSRNPVHGLESFAHGRHVEIKEICYAYYV